MSSKVEAMREKLQQELAAFNAMQKEFKLIVRSREVWEAQLTECTVVKNELDLVKDGENVFKLMGPVLTLMKLDAAKFHIATRIQYIEEELKRCEEQVRAHNTLTLDYRKKLTDLSNEIEEESKKEKAAQPSV